MAPFNFARRDYTALFEQFLDRLKSDLQEYTDWNHSDAGVSLGRLHSRELDQLDFYIDHVAGEGFVSTAQFKQSLIDIGRTVDYLPTLAAAATTTVRLTRKDGVTGAITLPQWSEFNRADGLKYPIIQAVTIPADQQYADRAAVQGILIEQMFEAADFKVMDWTKHPRVSLGKSVAGGGFTQVWHESAAGPVYWTEVDSFWRSGPNDLHFLLELNGDDDTVRLVLGDGVQGMAAPAEPLHVRFIRTDEAAGNCGHSMIYGLPDGFSDLITCTNIEPATGGAAAEDTESIRSMIPRMVRTQRRGLTKADYGALLEHFPGVLHVQALDRNDDTYWPHDYIVLYVVPDGGGPMSSLLKEQIWAQCGSWGHLGPWKERYILLEAVSVPVNISVRIGVLQGYSGDAVRTAVETAIADLLAPQNRTIGGPLEFAALHQAVSSVAGVSWAEFDSPKEDVTCKAGEILTQGVVTVAMQ